MSHWVVAPIVLPALTGALLVLLSGHGPGVQRALSLTSTLTLLAVAAGWVFASGAGGYHVYALGEWPAPFGIVLVLDRLAALMLLLTAILALSALVYAVPEWDGRGRYFHALLQFQWMGLNGAFLTGDLFNLFVFFEVLLIASYGLLLHGGGAARLRAGVHYVVINLVGSGLFLVAVSLLYGVTGTLNMADLALKVAVLGPAEATLASSAALLLLGVFGIKAALFPLYFWLPRAYPAASAPVAALFSIMTKVGVYAMLRVYPLIFGEAAGRAADVASAWLLPAGLITLALGMLGALASPHLRGLIAYLTVASAGTLVTAIGIGGATALSAALFYMTHSILTVGALFLLADLIASQRGSALDLFARAAPVAQPALLGTLYFVGVLAIAGLPPTGGFLGKVMVLQGALAPAVSGAVAFWVWSVVLVTSLMALVALARAGSALFWNVRPLAVASRPASPAATVAGVGLMSCAVGLSVLAAPLKDFTDAMAAQLLRPGGYVAAVLGPQAAGGTAP